LTLLFDQDTIEAGGGIQTFRAGCDEYEAVLIENKYPVHGSASSCSFLCPAFPPVGSSQSTIGESLTFREVGVGIPERETREKLRADKLSVRIMNPIV
jgi:hypothetical protein